MSSVTVDVSPSLPNSILKNKNPADTKIEDAVINDDDTKPPESHGKNNTNNISQSLSDDNDNDNDNNDASGKKSTMSASATLKTVWFNFAAPPKIPISKKIDFTKLDWNLLSTGSPACDAWLNPLDRITNSDSNMFNRYNCRVGSIMAAAMAEALDDLQVIFPSGKLINT